MKTNYLFPNSFKKSSGILFLISILGIILFPIINKDDNLIQLQANVFALFYDEGLKTKTLGWTNDDIFPELLGIMTIVSGLIFAFSKEKIEDEMISKIRTESLVWATYLSYAVLLFCIIFIYGFTFFNILTYNIFTILFVFILRFRWMLYKNNQTYSHEE